VDDVPDARAYLRGLIGKTIHTLTGRPNSIIAIDGDDVLVGTTRSPDGQAVPIAWVQEAMDRLYAQGSIEISVESVGYRSAFIGAVLATLPGAIAGNGLVSLNNHARR
jgi:hypothetical protein